MLNLCHTLAAVLVVQQAPAPIRHDTVTIIIAATTDVHGRAMDWDYERDRSADLGLVRAATIVDSLRRAHPGRVVLVDAGDLIQGNPFATWHARNPGWDTHPILDAMNRMGYTAATPGNHEFNFGLAVMQRSLGSARFPYVSSNIVDATTRRPVLPPFILLDVAGIRLGITGATTPGVLVWDGPYVRGVLDFIEVSEAVPPAVAAMRAAGAEVTMLVVHAGLDGPSSYDERQAPKEENVGAAIRRSSGLDVAVIGHTHREIADSTIGGTTVIQARNWVQSVAVLELRVVRENGRARVVSKRGRLIPMRGVAASQPIVEALAPAHTRVRQWITQPLGCSEAAMPLDRARLEDMPVIDFINHVQRLKTGSQLSSTAAFNARGGIPRGGVTMGDIASIYPYDNTLKAIRISGRNLRDYLDYATRFYRGLDAQGRPLINDSIPGYNFDIVSGVDYEIDLSQPMGRRITRLTYQNRPVADTDSFTIAVNNYRQQGGGGFTMLAGTPVTYDRGENIRDVLAEHLNGRTLRPGEFFVRNWSIRQAPAGAAQPETGAERPCP
jgi:2',3'-cyclic-nucleotide 2'-phosphodiesterase (5'-nucleotidase family)